MPVTNLERERLLECERMQEEAIRLEMDRLLADIGSDLCVLGLLEPGTGELVWKTAAGNLSDRYQRMATRPGKGLNGSVVKVGRGATLHVAELIAKRELHEYPILLAEKLRSAYAAPVMPDDKVRGVLLVGDRVKRIYRPDDRESISAAAGRIAKVLDTEFV